MKQKGQVTKANSILGATAFSAGSGSAFSSSTGERSALRFPKNLQLTAHSCLTRKRNNTPFSRHFGIEAAYSPSLSHCQRHMNTIYRQLNTHSNSPNPTKMLPLRTNKVEFFSYECFGPLSKKLSLESQCRDGGFKPTRPFDLRHTSYMRKYSLEPIKSSMYLWQLEKV